MAISTKNWYQSWYQSFLQEYQYQYRYRISELHGISISIGIKTSDLYSISIVSVSTFQTWKVSVSYRYRKKWYRRPLSYTYNCQFIFIFHLLMFPCFRCQITGMKHCTFIDRTREPPNRYQVFNHCNNIWKCVQCYYVLCFEPGVQECREVVTIGEWTDRIYEGTPPEHIITNVVSGRKMRIQK